MVAMILAAEEPRIHIPATDELIWGSIAFLIVFLFLARAVFPRIGKALEARSSRIAGDLEAAERSKVEADTMLEQYQRQLAEARVEVQRIIDEGKRTAESLRRELEARAQQEAQEIVNRARAEVAGERDRALQELRATIGELSIQLATKVVERELSDAASQRAMIQRVIEGLASTGNGQHS